MSEDVRRKPKFSAEQAESIAAQTFGLFGTASPLAGERDQNFKIETALDQYVLKIANPDSRLEVLELENQAIQIAHSISDFDSPQIVKSVENFRITPFQDAHNLWHIRCLTYVPGTPLAKFPKHTPDLLSEIGRCLGLLDQQLKALNQIHIAKRDIQWDLARAPQAIQRALRSNQNREQTDLLSHYYAMHAEIAPRIDRLDRSVIHNDANDHNVMIAIDPVNDMASIGLIDFGDLVFSTTINDLAICSAYCMLGKSQPIQALKAVVTGYHESRPLNDSELSSLFPLACLRLAQSISLSAEQQRREPTNEYLSISEKPAWETLQCLTAFPPNDVCQQLWDTCQTHTGSHVSKSSLSAEQIKTLRKRFVAPSLSLSYDKPLKITRGQGQYLYDDSDLTYLDCVNNVCHVGHCHPTVVAAAQEQIAVLNTNTRYLHPNIVRYAERLTQTLPEPLNVCFFVNSGSEANDLALRMAHHFTQQQDLFVIDHAYHGHTAALIDISPYKFNGPGGKGKPETVHVMDLPDTYRGRYRRGRSDAATEYTQDAILQIKAVAAETGIAGFIAESMLGCGGQIPLPNGYLKGIYDTIREVGGVCIADEVQVGFGRIGTHFWGFERSHVVPDIVTMGKPIGNGHPLAAVVTTPAIAEAFHNGMEYFNTFGGNPVSCGVGMAVLDVIQQEDLQSHALQIGQYLLEKLHHLQTAHPTMGDVRGQGLFLGIEIVKDPNTREPDSTRAKQIVEDMKSQRILLSIDGPHQNVIKFKPPMSFDLANADRVVMTLERVLNDLNRTS